MTDHSKLTIRQYEPMPVVIFDENNQPIVTVKRDHTVVLHQPEKTNEAARLFWNAVQQYGMAHCVETHGEE